MNTLHKVFHGLGDNVQFTAVLRHLHKYRPHWKNYIQTGKGKDTAFGSLAETWRGEQVDLILHHDWHENFDSYCLYPSTKTTKCLFEKFGITPDWSLLRYQIEISGSARNRVAEYLKTLPDKPYVVLHYNGNNLSVMKNVADYDMQAYCQWLATKGVNVVVLDWDFRTRFVDNRTVFNPNKYHFLWRGLGTGCAETVAALMERSSLNVCVDSGPQKIAFALDTPCIALWTKHHPIHYCDQTPNALHLIPHDHARFIRGKSHIGLEVFERNYQYCEYQNNLLPHLTEKTLEILKKTMN